MAGDDRQRARTLAPGLLQLRDKVPWKLEPCPPTKPRPTRTRPFGGGGPLSWLRQSRRRAVVAAILASLATLFVVLLVLNLSSGERKVEHRIPHLYAVGDAHFVRAMGNLLGPPLVPGNSVVELINGDRIFPSMLEAIRSARRSITFETYIYWSGRIGEEFAEALCRARAGRREGARAARLGRERRDRRCLPRAHGAGGRPGRALPAARLVHAGEGQPPDPPQAPRRGRPDRLHGRGRHRRQVARGRAGSRPLARHALSPRGAGGRADAGGLSRQLAEDPRRGPARRGLLPGACRGGRGRGPGLQELLARRQRERADDVSPLDRSGPGEHPAVGLVLRSGRPRARDAGRGPAARE